MKKGVGLRLDVHKILYNIYKFNKHVSQFQILADSSKYISNNIAYDEIKAENTENLVVNFINNRIMSIRNLS